MWLTLKIRCATPRRLTLLKTTFLFRSSTLRLSPLSLRKPQVLMGLVGVLLRLSQIVAHSYCWTFLYPVPI
ncbi:hypothetical protein ACLKA7_000104, partial [Drosophila subpalustris]